MNGNALRWQYCSTPCEECPVAKMRFGSEQVDFVFQQFGPDIDGSTDLQAATDMAAAVGVSEPGLAARAVVRHVTGQCSTSPETSSLR